MKFCTAILMGLLVIALVAQSHAETRYVSHSGNNAFPYTTWETAANTIEAANLATLPGDTMFIDTGSFYLTTQIVTQPNVVIRGKGVDSTAVLGSDTPEVLHFALFQPEDSTLFEDIHFIGHGTHYGIVKLAGDPWRSLWCHRCEFSGFGSTPVSCNQMRFVEIKDCWFEDWETYAMSLTERGDFVIENNTFDMANGSGEMLDFFGHTGTETIRNNVFLGGGLFGINGGTAGRLELTTNLFCKCPYLWYGVSTGANDIFIANNTFYIVHLIATSGYVLDIYPNNMRSCLVYNNVFAEYAPRIHFRGPIPDNADIRIAYNCFFSLQPYPEYAFLFLENDTLHLDSAYANNRSDPMLVNPDSGDFHLQRGSPCIDGGTPWLLDADSSRSDLGTFGGAGGAVYAYVDYPPRRPYELTAWRDGSRVILSWYRNRESDLSHYILFRSEQSPVELDSTNVLAYLSPSGKPLHQDSVTKHLLLVGDTTSLPDKSLYEGFIPVAMPENLVSIFYCDNTTSAERDYYYALVAVDSSGLVSSPSFIELNPPQAVGHPADEPVVEQNYPNPFNAVTAVVYNLPNIGSQPAPVELTIYNVLGQVVRQLVNDREYPGKHIVYWDGTDSQGHPVASGVYLYQLRVSGIDFIENRKMIVMK